MLSASDGSARLSAPDMPPGMGWPRWPAIDLAVARTGPGLTKGLGRRTPSTEAELTARRGKPHLDAEPAITSKESSL